MVSNEIAYLIVHFACGFIALGIIVYVQWKERGELTVNDITMLWMIPLGVAGLVLCLFGVWCRFSEKHQDKTLISRKKPQSIKVVPSYKPELWKDD